MTHDDQLSLFGIIFHWYAFSYVPPRGIKPIIVAFDRSGPLKLTTSLHEEAFELLRHAWLSPRCSHRIGVKEKEEETGSGEEDA